MLTEGPIAPLMIVGSETPSTRAPECVPRKRDMNLLTDQRGQTTVIMALCIGSVCGMAGFAVDVGMMFRAKRVLQTAADSGAMAGVAEMNYRGVSSAVFAATAQNGITNGSGGATVLVHGPPGGPSSGPHQSQANFVEVIVSQSQPTYFMKVLGLNSMTVSARAVAGVSPSSGCIYTLNPSGTDIGLTGSGNLSLPGCGITVNSASSNAVSLVGSGSITAQSIGIVGGYTTTGSGTLNPTPITGVAPTANPLAYMVAPVYAPASCLPNPNFVGSGTYTLGPAIPGGTVCYNGLSLVGSGTLTLSPGVYVINGAFKETGSPTISGTGVTIYLPPTTGSVSLTGSGSLNISAPTSGTYDGILFFEDPGDTNTMSITGSGSSTLSGIFYAPSASVSITGSSGSTFNADLIVKSLSITGSGTLNNYSSINSSSPLVSARLVE